MNLSCRCREIWETSSGVRLTRVSSSCPSAAAGNRDPRDNIAMDVEGKVRRVKVMSYQEIRGRPIAQSSFMNQYRGKTNKSALEVGRDIIGISGATISSRAATFAVKKALVIYEEVYHK